MAFSTPDNIGNPLSYQQNAKVDDVHGGNHGIDHINMVFKMGEVWDNLSVQLSFGNQIPAIPIAVYRGWSPKERATLKTLMM